MTIRVHFNTNSTRDEFANRFKLNVPLDSELHLDMPWDLLNHVKDHQSVDNIEQHDLETVHDFIVKGDESVISQHATIKENLGNNFFIVSTNNAVELSSHVDSIEITSVSATFWESDVSTVTQMNVQGTILDPTGPDAQWARIRVASRYRPLLTSYSLHDVNFLSEPELIIIDTGINFEHPEFQYDGLTFENLYVLPVFNGDFTDDIGHGTAVASMAVGKNLGVGRKCKLVSVKIGGVINGVTRNASLYELGCAIDAIISRVSANPLKTRIVNISWGVSRSTWLDAKIQSLIDAGVTVICAAGNEGISVEDISPAGLDTVITVGATDKFDIPAGFNNISPGDSTLVTGYGLSLDIFAPGVDVIVAHGFGYSKTSGTSLSAPLVSGIATEIAALNEGFVSYNTVKELILNTATEDALLFEDDKFSQNQNKLAYIYTSDSLCVYKETDMVSYLGVSNPETQADIVADLNSSLTVEDYKKVHPADTITYSIEWYDPQVQVDYSPFVTVDSTTGLVTIKYPTVALPEETKLKMIEFKGVASTDKIKMETNKIFFFVVNPLYKDTAQSDVTLALSEINSVAYFAFWGAILK